MTPIPYEEGLALQATSNGSLPVFFRPLSVVTAGKNVSVAESKLVDERLRKIGINLIHANRGGQFTCHYPGQLVIFPVVNLAAQRIGLRSFVERALSSIASMLAPLGIPSVVRLDQAGVWTKGSERKICSIGLKVERGGIRHGLALNVLRPDTEISEYVYNLVEMCGLSGRCITSIEEETGIVMDFEELRGLVLQSWSEHFTGS